MRAYDSKSLIVIESNLPELHLRFLTMTSISVPDKSLAVSLEGFLCK